MTPIEQAESDIQSAKGFLQAAERRLEEAKNPIRTPLELLCDEINKVSFRCVDARVEREGLFNCIELTHSPSNTDDACLLPGGSTWNAIRKAGYTMDYFGANSTPHRFYLFLRKL